MTLFNLALLAIIQGLTEFLPISSSGHLILLPTLTGLADQGLALDVAVHVGTLGAVILYFWPDVRQVLIGTGQLLRGRADSPAAMRALCLVVATIPVVIAGLVIAIMDWNALLRSTAVIGWTMLIFGLVLYWADKTGQTRRKAEGWTMKHAVIMGLWQALALIPGTSRSGITITAARHLGYAREDAARLAMLMSIPTILASGAVLGIDVLQEADWQTARDGAIAAAFAFVAALAALWGMMRLLRHVSFTPYVIYRVLLGLYLLWFAYA